MKARLKRKIASMVLRTFNRVFASSVKMEDIETVRLLARENLHFGEKDVESIRLLSKEGLHFGADDVATMRLVLREGLLKDLEQGAQLCYSQEGESLILDRLFTSRKTGFYVDVGAHHPKRFSNTYALYKKGWRGINIDPTPGVKELFDEYRPGDAFVAAAVLSAEGARDFYMFTESALNTFSRSLADEYQQTGYKLAEVRPIKSRKLAAVLQECKVDHPIDLMSIDVEGYELDVLESNDWQRYRPRVLLVEIINFDLSRPEANPVHNFALERGYVLFAKTFNTVFYKDARIPEGAPDQ
jgi:FkbM family methyltransferase